LEARREVGQPPHPAHHLRPGRHGTHQGGCALERRAHTRPCATPREE
jgi:hypothetical protein